MDAIYIVANWKSSKTTFEARQWLQEFQMSTDKEIVVCPSFTLLPIMKKTIQELKLPIKLGAQDISPFGEGAYTGEINGKQIKEFADYVIIGHSERRSHFQEDDAILEKKVQMAKSYNLEPIFCVQDGKTIIPQGVAIAAYEPIFAIGSGNPDTPQNANDVAKKIKDQTNITVLYGGSVTSVNVHQFTNESSISGVLVGGTSLDVKEFSQIIHHA